MLFNLSFQRPIGSPADVKELEYITALHQTGSEDEIDWSNPSIRAEDVQIFLMSRHGIQVEKEEVLNQIFHGLAGGNTEEDSIDITELSAILIIPYLVKTVLEKHPTVSKRDLFTSARMREYIQEEDELQQLTSENSSMIGHVLKIILRHAGVDSTVSPRLTKELLKKIFATYEEPELVEDDDLLEEMIHIATDGDIGGVLDANSFARGLAADVGMYDVNSEARVSTHFYDVFGNPREAEEVLTISGTWNTNSVTDEENGAETNSKGITKVRTFSQIDFLSGTFWSKFHFLLCWIALIMAIFSYTDSIMYNVHICGELLRPSLECEIINKMCSWLVTMITYVAFGVPFIMILSLGNQNHERYHTLESLVTIVGVAILIILPAHIDFDTFLLNFSHKEPDKEKYYNEWILYYVKSGANTLIGSLLILIQLGNILSRFNQKARICFQGSSLRNEYGIKRACRKKIHQFVRNAYELHKSEDEIESTALLNYNKIAGGEKTEIYGGRKWIWSSLTNDKLISDEGIWIPSRLFNGVIAQILALFVCYIGAILFARGITNKIYSDTPLTIFEDTIQGTDSSGRFNASSCVFLKSNETGKYIGPAVCPNTFLAASVDDMEELTEGLSSSFLCSLIQDSPLPLNDKTPFISGVQTSKNQCPQLHIPSPNDPLFVDTYESNSTHYCRSSVSACIITDSADDGDKGLCILGINNNFLSNLYRPQYEGDLCNSYNDIHKISEQFKINIGNKTENLPDWTVSRRILEATLFTAPTIALSIGLMSTISFLPNVTILVLKFRSGVKNTVRDHDFVKFYRTNIHRATSLFGAMFWGAIFSFYGLGIFVGLIMFLSMWVVTRGYMAEAFGNLIGILITVILRIGVMTFLSKYLYKGFYRSSHPAVGNIVNLIVECWDLGVTAGFVAFRTFKIAVISVVYMGRFDVPLLSEDANKAGFIYVDAYPMWLRLNLLAADAHRHPYMERLGLLYMMKLKHGDEFGKRSGSMWRLLFIQALMPWLRKYRISKDPSKETNDGSVDGIFRSMRDQIVQLKSEISLLQGSEGKMEDQRAIVEENGGMTLEDDDMLDASMQTNLTLFESCRENIDEK